MSSCTYYDSYYLSSPDGSRCITLEYSTSLIPSDSQFVKLYIGAPPANKDQYVKMLWSDIGGLDIDWNSSPLKVRSWLIKENTFSDKIIDAKLEMSSEEDEEFRKNQACWKSYDFTWVSSGKYKSCK